jgi:hypothetical protein
MEKNRKPKIPNERKHNKIQRKTNSSPKLSVGIPNKKKRKFNNSIKMVLRPKNFL